MEWQQVAGSATAELHAAQLQSVAEPTLTIDKMIAIALIKFHREIKKRKKALVEQGFKKLREGRQDAGWMAGGQALLAATKIGKKKAAGGKQSSAGGGGQPAATATGLFIAGATDGRVFSMATSVLPDPLGTPGPPIKANPNGGEPSPKRPKVSAATPTTV